MDAALEKTLIEALDALERGDSIDLILSHYPDEATELRPILETAAQLPNLPPAPSASARAESHRTLLQRAQQLREEASRPKDSPAGPRFLFSFVSILVVLLIAGAALVPASAGAIPGDTLYPVKRGIESMRLILASESGESQLRRQFEKERNSEVYEMLKTGRDGQAGYTGEIVALSAETWEIGHITVQITDRTTIAGVPRVGERVEAHCRIEDGRVYAEHLEVLQPASETAPAP